MTVLSADIETSQADKLIVSNGIFYDSCEFHGNIYSGPLIAINDSPLPKTVTVQSDRVILKFDEIGPVNGTYGDYSWTYAKSTIVQSFDSNFTIYYTGSLLLYDKNRKNIYEENYSKSYSRPVYKYDFIYTTIIESSSKTLKLVDLPTSVPGESGVVYRDGDTLKISV